MSKKDKSADQTDRPFPWYLMKIGGERKFLPISEAGVAYDSGWVNVEIVGDVLEADGTVRPITEKERARISDIADEYSASK